MKLCSTVQRWPALDQPLNARHLFDERTPQPSGWLHSPQQ
jgi:hypothetical protein